MFWWLYKIVSTIHLSFNLSEWSKLRFYEPSLQLWVAIGNVDGFDADVILFHNKNAVLGFKLQPVLQVDDKILIWMLQGGCKIGIDPRRSQDAAGLDGHALWENHKSEVSNSFLKLFFLSKLKLFCMQKEIVFARKMTVWFEAVPPPVEN